MPGRSMDASSWMPMPLRIMRSEPILNAPEQVMSWFWPWRSRSTTHMSTTGARLVKASMGCTYWLASSRTADSRTSAESPSREPTNTTPLSRYVMHSGMGISPNSSTLRSLTVSEPSGLCKTSSSSMKSLPAMSPNRYLRPRVSTRQ